MEMTYYDMVRSNASKYKGSEDTMWDSIKLVSGLLAEFVVKHPDLKERYWEFMREQHEAMAGHHFNEEYAKWQVSRMHHKAADGVEYKGEHWSVEATSNVLAKYRSKIAPEYNEWDFYVALNATYHDYCVWAKSKFGDSAEGEIIEMAVVFWFLDEDWPNKSKVWDYFRK